MKKKNIYLKEIGQKVKIASALRDIKLTQTQIELLRKIESIYRRKRQGVILFSGLDEKTRLGAGSYLANILKQDFYRIDLSLVISKYIGETEKNLEKLFTTAEAANTILFFEEADVLLGKRTAVKDSHDRYTNIEINSLLQRLEDYHGLIILSSNLRQKTRLSFPYKFDYVVNFDSKKH